MKVLLDNNMNPRIYRLLGSIHEVHHAYHLGWSTLQNGKLLAAAEQSQFQVLITADKSIPSEQNLRQFAVALVILPNNEWDWIRRAHRRILQAVETTTPGDFRRLLLEDPADDL